MIDLSINPQETEQKIVSFIKKTVTQAGFKKVVVAVSGGIDSAVSFALAVRALGKENVYALMLPYGKLNREGIDDSELLIQTLKIPVRNIKTINIETLVDAFSAVDKSLDDSRKGSMMTRVRMIVLFDKAKKERALVAGTENKSEYLLGYFTRFGDAASDFEPLHFLYKTQVRELANYLRIPDKIINKSPTAGLWAGQTDEGEMGFTYREADQILNLFVDLKKREDQIEKEGFSKELVEKVLSQHKKTAFMREGPYLLNG